MRRVNEAILRERHPIPTLEETMQDLNGPTGFFKTGSALGVSYLEF
jgi:hypothetical protein